MTEPSTTGGCLCGGVRFELTRPAEAAGYCHCTRCQKRTGSAARCRRVCRECGSHLFSRNPDDATQMSIRMAAFDGDPGVRPSWRTFVAYAAPWEPVPDDGLSATRRAGRASGSAASARRESRPAGARSAAG